MSKFAKKVTEATETPTEAPKKKLLKKIDAPAPVEAAKVVKKAVVKKEETPTEGKKTGRANQYKGLKIKVLKKDHGLRAGSIRGLLFDQLVSCKTTDEALEKSIEHAGKVYKLEGWVFRIAKQLGVIELV